MWKNVRVLILLLILLAILIDQWQQRARLDWQNSFFVALYPVNADGSAHTAQYIRQLKSTDFAALDDYFKQQSARYGVHIYQPVHVQLGAAVPDIPPAPPQNGAVLSVMWWSLKFRYFAWQNSPDVAIKPHIRLYLLYYNPATHHALSHSTALEKGQIGRVNLFASPDQAAQNLVVVAHELLHTFGARDKYDLATGLPIFPLGYADAQQMPLYPQIRAELMGGRVPLSAEKAVTPDNLQQTTVGAATALEIGWLRN